MPSLLRAEPLQQPTQCDFFVLDRGLRQLRRDALPAQAATDVRRTDQRCDSLLDAIDEGQIERLDQDAVFDTAGQAGLRRQIRDIVQAERRCDTAQCLFADSGPT